MTGYSFRWREARWDFQLNVSNLLDKDDPIYTGTTTFQNRTVMQSFYYLEPRKYTLTATLRI